MKPIFFVKLVLFTFMILFIINISASTDLAEKKPPNAWDIPSFKLKGIDGKIHSLDEWKGKVILLNFWASWCPPCLKEAKDFINKPINMKELHNTLSKYLSVNQAELD